MANRTVRVILEAVTGAYEAGMKRAGQATDQVSKGLEKAGQQRQNLDAVGKAMLGVGAAAGTLLTAVAKTGIEYNTLQQTSRAALRTILGGAEQANRQMDKLDEFARTSPFAKDVFIRAQQQMLGFGIETEKVIPYLSAINDTVAAVGGNNHMVAEIATIMSQISASAKITATDLREFGNRGVDAATIIGSQMGMTGAEIRESITAGTLDAQDALDALAAGMSERFEGASANVKETMAGAADRVKAAFRDMSASIMEPFVSQDGGGILVDATNQVADFLRSIERLPQPVKLAGAGVTALVAGIGLLGGGFLLLLPRIQETRLAMAALRAETGLMGATARGTSAAMRGMAGVAGKLGIALLAIEGIKWLDGIGEGDVADAQHMTNILQGLADGTRDLDSAFRSVDGKAISTDLFGAIDSIYDLETAMQAIDRAWWSSTEANKARDAFREIDEALTQLNPMEQAAAFAHMEQQMTEYGWTAEQIGEQFPQYMRQVQEALADASGEWGSYGQDMQSVMAVMRGDLPYGLVQTEQGIMHVSQALAEGIDYVNHLGEAVSAAAIEMADTADMADLAAQAYGGWTVEQRMLRAAAEAAAEQIREQGGDIEDLDEAVREAAESYAQWIGELAAGSQAFIDVGGTIADFVEEAKFNFAGYLDALEEQVAAQQNWERNMIVLAGSASDGLLQHLASLGPEGAPLVQALVDGSDEQLARMEAVFGSRGQAATGAWAEELVNAADVWAALAQVAGDEAVDAAAAEFLAGKTTLRQIIADYDLEAVLNANVDPAITAVQAALARINGMSATVRIGAYHAAGMDAPAATGGYGQHLADAYLAGGGMVHRKAYPMGGPVYGPGTKTSDSIPARLSRGEFVQRAAAVDKLGVDAMYRINSGGFDRDALRSVLGLAGGGLVTERPHTSISPHYTRPGHAGPLTASVDGDALAAAITQGISGLQLHIDGQWVDARIEAANSRTGSNVKRGAF